jgi:hypothetical protein
MFKAIVFTAALAAASLAQAQTQAQAPSSPAKKELVARVLQLQQGGVEQLANNIAAAPAMQLQQRAGMALQGLPPERREAVARDIEADLRKYVEEAAPIVRDHAAKLAPATIGPLLEERFTEDELRQVIAMLESPVIRKFIGMSAEMQRAIGEKVVAETRGEIEPKVKVLEQTVARRLGQPTAASATPAPAATPPRPAASAAKK